MTKNFLLFGANGAIGKSLRASLTDDGWTVCATGRRASSLANDPHWITIDPFASNFNPHILDTNGPFSAVCWAQGDNLNDSIYNVDEAKHLALYKANCLFVIKTLNLLLERKLLAPASRLCIISSIWQKLARQNKLSYCVTKSALEGLVLSAAADLAADGHLINAVLPGALDTPMTRANLSSEQINQIAGATPFKRLSRLEDVISAVKFLCAPTTTGITGQFITVDLGFSNVRLV